MQCLLSLVSELLLGLCTCPPMCFSLAFLFSFSFLHFFRPPSLESFQQKS